MSKPRYKTYRLECCHNGKLARAFRDFSRKTDAIKWARRVRKLCRPEIRPQLKLYIVRRET